jgi:hypothetical protein
MMAHSSEQEFIFDAFISYSHKDWEAVNRLVSRLKQDDFRLWFDDEQIGGGDPLSDAMVQGINQSRHVIVCLSLDYLHSEWANFERLVNQSLDPANLKRRMIPVQIAVVDQIPLAYKYVYCPDLTNMKEEEYQKAIKRIRESKSESNQVVSPLSESEVQLDDVTNLPRKPQPPKPTARLEALGFRFHPFEWRVAEQMDPDVLEQTYTPLPEYDKKVMKLGSSTALLAPFGGGKTAGRLKLAGSLKTKQELLLKNLPDLASKEDIPLVVQFADFENVYELLPAKVTLRNHAPKFLDSIGASVFDLIVRYHQLFMKQTVTVRDFWWNYLETYLLEKPLRNRLINQMLTNDYRRVSSRPRPFTDGTSLVKILENIIDHLGGLRITSLIILVDEVDAQTRNQSDMESIIEPIVNHLGLFSISGVIWKFFLPALLVDVVKNSNSYMRGRLEILPIIWDEDSLKLFLSERLKWASEGKIGDIANTCEQNLITNLGDVDARLARLALRHVRHAPPRALLDLADSLFQTSQTVGSVRLTLENWIDFERRINVELRK